MKKLHIHLAVNEMSKNINFYSALFNADPSVEKEDYAKWNLTDPSLNFAISNRGHNNGLNHLGIQVEKEEELEEISIRLKNSKINHSQDKASSCCYAQSNKHWTKDPQGIAWESFRTLSQINVFSEDVQIEGESNACCVGDKNNDNSCCQ